MTAHVKGSGGLTSSLELGFFPSQRVNECFYSLYGCAYSRVTVSINDGVCDAALAFVLGYF